jgi:uncharacterized protein YndB with AHSA1/START domain
VINRPIKDVFEYVIDFDKMPNWTSGLVESKKTSDGPIGVGTTFSGSMKMLGRRIDNTGKVTAFESNKKISHVLTSGPVEANAEWNFEPTDDGTKVTVSVQADLAGFFKLAEPIIKGIMRKQWEADYDGLKALLEGQA